MIEYGLIDCRLLAVLSLSVTQVRVDHRTASVSFGTGVGMTQDIIREGPSIQNMPSEQMRYQLINMAVALDKAMSVISPTELKVRQITSTSRDCTLCLRNDKDVTLFIVVITLLNVFQFLAETYPGKFETNTLCTAGHVSFYCFFFCKN